MTSTPVGELAFRLEARYQSVRDAITERARAGIDRVPRREDVDLSLGRHDRGIFGEAFRLVRRGQIDEALRRIEWASAAEAKTLMRGGLDRAVLERAIDRAEGAAALMAPGMKAAVGLLRHASRDDLAEAMRQCLDASLMRIVCVSAVEGNVAEAIDLTRWASTADVRSEMREALDYVVLRRAYEAAVERRSDEAIELMGLASTPAVGAEMRLALEQGTAQAQRSHSLHEAGPGGSRGTGGPAGLDR